MLDGGGEVLGSKVYLPDRTPTSRAALSPREAGSAQGSANGDPRWTDVITSTRAGED